MQQRTYQSGQKTRPPVARPPNAARAALPPHAAPPQRGASRTRCAVNRPGDLCEQEADRIADAVVRNPETRESRAALPALSSVQAKEQAGIAPAISPDAEGEISSLGAGGRPLPKRERTFFESRFGQDFSQVRVHSDARAAQTASALQARAFTRGRDIVFGAGEYAPERPEGRRLMAHELTHVVQQSAQTTAGVAAGNAMPLIQRQSAPSPPSSVPTAAFSVNQATYLTMLDQALQRMNGNVIEQETYAPFVLPLLQKMRDSLIWRNAAGAESGGRAITYSHPSAPSIKLNLRMVLDDQANPLLDGEFSSLGATNGTLSLFIQKNSTTDDLLLTMYHEALHMARWIMQQSSVQTLPGVNARALRSLNVSPTTGPSAVLRKQLDRLASSVNDRRAAGNEISSAQLDRMAPWLMEEVMARVETEVFRLAESVQQVRRTHNPAVITGTVPSLQVSPTMIDHYVFDLSRCFLPTDRPSPTSMEQLTLRQITDLLQRLFEVTVRRRFSIEAYLPYVPDVPFDQMNSPTPVTPPRLTPLPLP